LVEIDRGSKVHIEGGITFMHIYKGCVVGQGVLL
jgi:hypothetical protein